MRRRRSKRPRSFGRSFRTKRNDERRKANPLQVARSASRTAVAAVGVAVRFRKRMMVRAKQPQVFGAVIACVAVDVIDMQRNKTGAWIALAPSADGTL